MNPKYRKKPLIVEAYQWTGNIQELIKWAKSSPLRGSYKFEHRKGWFNKEYLLISTNKGKMKASLGDWIVKGVENEYYPVKPQIFKKTYEPYESL